MTSLRSNTTEWSRAPLRTLAKPLYGKALPREQRGEEGAVPVFGSAGLVGRSDRELTSGPTIIIGRKGNAGTVHFCTGPCWPIDTTYYLSAPASLDPKFLFLQLQNANLARFDSSTAIPSLRIQDLERAEIVFPALSEQRRIVGMVERLFGHIDFAEAMLQRLLVSIERLSETAYATALDGPWPRAKLKNIAQTSSGGTPSRKRPEYYGGDIHWVKSGELRDGFVRSTCECITPEGLASTSARLLKRGTLLMAMYGATIGKLGVLDLDQAATNQAVCAIEPLDPLFAPYLRVCLRALRRKLIQLGQGGAQPNISQQVIKNLDVPMPPQDWRDRIVPFVEQNVELAERVKLRIEGALRQVNALRRSILASAFSGSLASVEAA